MINKAIIRSKHAEAAIALITNCRSDYLVLVRKSPALIQNSGLIQAMTYYLAKSRKTSTQAKAHEKLFEHFSEWIRHADGENLILRTNDGSALIHHLVGLDSLKIMRLSEGTILYAEWLKRMAEAFINE